MHGPPLPAGTAPIGPVRRSPSRVGWPSVARLPLALTVALAVACFLCGAALRLVEIDRAITADEGLWMQRTIRFGANLARANLGGTYRTGHPGVTVMWAGLAGIGHGRLGPLSAERLTQPERLERAPGYLDALAAARVAVALLAAALAALAALLACKLVGTGPGLAGSMLLLLDPYVVGTSRVLHVDALLAPLMTVCALAGLAYWTVRPHPAYLALGALAGGLALLTKTTAVYAVAFFVLVGVAAPLARRRGWRSVLPAVAAWGLLAAATYGALWPALWVDPLGRLGDVLAFARAAGGEPHETGHFFLGRPIADDPGPLFYPVALAFRLGPVACLGLAALAASLALPSGRAPRGEAVRARTLWLLAYALLFVGMMTLGAKKLDRYMLPAIWVLDILAGVGLWLLFSRIRSARVAAAGAALALALQAATLWRAYPYPLAAYNPLVGGLATARRTMLVGWGEGLEQVADYLNGRPDARALNVAVGYPHVLRPRFPGTTYDVLPYLRADTAAGRPRPDYVVVYVNAAQRGLIPPAARAAIAAGPPEFTAFVHGEEVAWLYRPE
jgi:hypothetical protein